MKSLYETILSGAQLIESTFNTSTSENANNIMFLDALKKMIGMDGYKACLYIDPIYSSFSSDEQFDILKSNSYYDGKTKSMHIGVNQQDFMAHGKIYDLSNIYKICQEKGLIVNNITIDNFECSLSIDNSYKAYNGKNKIYKISSESPMGIFLNDGRYKNMDFSEMGIMAETNTYNGAFNVWNAIMSNVNFGSHPKNSLSISMGKAYSDGPLLFNNVTGEFNEVDATIYARNAVRWDRELSKACFVDYDPTIKHGDKDAVAINPDILANLGLDKIKCKKINIKITLDHGIKSSIFEITAADGDIKLTYSRLS